jgi:hypothetical protein
MTTPPRPFLHSLWVLVPGAMVGPPVAGILIMVVFGGALRETAAFEFGLFIGYPAALIALCLALATLASPGKTRAMVGTLALCGSLFWWLVMIAGSIAP